MSPYDFKPEYVTEAEGSPRETSQASDMFDLATDAVIARERLTRYIDRHRDYHDRDRDVLLLHLLDAHEHLNAELATIKRMLDVLVKRSAKT